MSISDIFTAVSITLAGFAAILGLLGWIVHILMGMQSTMAYMRADMQNLTSRMNHVEQHVLYEQHKGTKHL